METSHFDVRPYLWCRTGRTFPGICCQRLERAAKGCPEHLHSSIVSWDSASQNGPCILIAVNTRACVHTQLPQVTHVPALPEHQSVLTHIKPLGKLCSQSENQAREGGAAANHRQQQSRGRAEPFPYLWKFLLLLLQLCHGEPWLGCPLLHSAAKRDANSGQETAFGRGNRLFSR